MNQAIHVEEQKEVQRITAVTVSGYKSIAKETTIEIRPLTLLAGANSSGKSSMMQPLLLLKQTLEVPYDPASLHLSGPNVKVTSAKQILSSLTNAATNQFTSGISLMNENQKILSTFKLKPQNGLEVENTQYFGKTIDIVLSQHLTVKEVKTIIYDKLSGTAIEPITDLVYIQGEENLDWLIKQRRCFLTLELRLDKNRAYFSLVSSEIFENHIRDIIHVSGNRGNPQRTYLVTAVSEQFPGTFETYVASVVHRWQSTKDTKLENLVNHLHILGLASKISAKRLDDTQVELQVGRLPHHNNGGDTVSIADVGFGVSQVLPVVVGLLAAKPGQMVYIEQPEIHLHPRAQVALAQILADAANRGVQVVAETHSSLLLQSVQSLVAEGYISPDKVKVHWFQRQEDGATQIHSADLDESGAFGDWPVDFADVEMETMSRYMEAAEKHLVHL